MKSFCYLTPVSCSLLLACSTALQPATWEYTGGPYAQNISTLFIDEHNKSHLVAGLANGDVYTSMDEGNAWRKLSTIRANSGIYCFIQHPDQAKRFFALTGSGLFQSTNSGESWMEIVVDPAAAHTSIRALTIEPYNTQVMYAGVTGHGIYKTTDGGGIWIPSNNGFDSLALPRSDVYEIVIDPSKPDNIYAAMREIGIVRSGDGGRSWEKMTSIIGSGGVAPTSIVLHPKSASMQCFGMEAGSIYKSLDGGQTWSPTHFGSGGDKAVHLAMHPGNHEVLYAGTENDVLLSSNFGTTWKSIANELPHVATSIAVAPGTPDPVLYAYGEGIGLSRSTNNGAAWQPVKGRLGGSTVTAVAGNKRGDVLYAAVGASVHQWRLQTQKWISASNGLTGGTIACIALDTDSSTIVHAATATGIFSTTDGGASWSARSEQLRGKPVRLIATHPVFKTRILAESQTELFVSTNRGITWNPTKPLTERYQMRSLTFSNVDAGIVLGATATSGVILSTNGGLSWENNRYGLESNDLNAVTLDDRDRQTLYAWTVRGTGFRSTNKGLVWDRYSPPWQSGDNVRLVFDRYKPAEVVALIGTNQLYYSASGGATWFSIPTQPLEGDVVSACWNSETATFYTGMKDAGVYRVSLAKYLRKLFGE